MIDDCLSLRVKNPLPTLCRHGNYDPRGGSSGALWAGTMRVLGIRAMVVSDCSIYLINLFLRSQLIMYCSGCVPMPGGLIGRTKANERLSNAGRPP